MPDKFWIAAGCSSGFIVAAFFLAGGYQEVKHQLWTWKRERRRGGYLL